MNTESKKPYTPAALEAIDNGIQRLIDLGGMKTGQRSAFAVDELRDSRARFEALIIAADAILAAGVSDLEKLDVARRVLAKALDRVNKAS